MAKKKEKKEKKQNGYFRHMAEAIKMELREHKSSFMVYLILRILVYDRSSGHALCIGILSRIIWTAYDILTFFHLKISDISK